MNGMTKSQVHVGCLVARTVLGKSSKPFQREVERLIRNNGSEWFTARMKHLFAAAHHLRSGNPEKARSVYQEANIAYHKGDLTPKGPFRPVFRTYVQARKPSVIRRYAAVHRFYTTQVLPELSKRQSEKAFHSITDPWTPQEGSEEYISNLMAFARAWGENRHKDEFHLSQTPYNVLAPNTQKYSKVELSREDRKVPLRSLTASLMSAGFVPEGLEETQPFPLLIRGADTDGPIGRIGVIQEQGCKARVVAIPSAALQYAFWPLHHYLAEQAQLHPASVAHDQERAIYGLIDHMDQDLPAFSTDLSSATDRFPLPITQAMLEGMGLEIYSRALEEVTQREWESPWGNIRYGTGQPMGLMGSFPAFHMSNIMMAEWAYFQVLRRAEGDPVTKFNNGFPFFVLGDDIVFSDARVEEEYRHSMEILGVPISEEKSFHGDLVEFAGFIVTKERKDRTFAFQPYKIPPGDRISNPINFLGAMGIKARVISPLWEHRVDMFGRTWSDRSPGLSPWITTDREPSASSWDASALDNEIQVLSLKYPSSFRPRTAGVRYSDGSIKAHPDDEPFVIIGRSRNKSKDLPQAMLESNREMLGQQPKHPRRVTTPYMADPLIREQEDRYKVENQPSQGSPVKDSPASDSGSHIEPSVPSKQTDGDLARTPSDEGVYLPVLGTRLPSLNELVSSIPLPEYEEPDQEAVYRPTEMRQGRTLSDQAEVPHRKVPVPKKVLSPVLDGDKPLVGNRSNHTDPQAYKQEGKSGEQDHKDFLPLSERFKDVQEDLTHKRNLPLSARFRDFSTGPDESDDTPFGMDR